MKFPIKKFKKISSDGETTTLKHEDGHEIKVVHKHVSPKIREQIASMDAVKMAEGGEAKVCLNRQCKSYGVAHPNCKCYGGYASGGSVDHFCDSGKAHKKGCQYFDAGGMTSANDAGQSAYQNKMDWLNQVTEGVDPNGFHFGMPPLSQEAKESLAADAGLSAKNKAQAQLDWQEKDAEAARARQADLLAKKQNLGIIPQMEPMPGAPDQGSTDPNAQPADTSGGQPNPTAQDPYGFDAYQKAMQSARGMEMSGLKGSAEAEQQQARDEQAALQQQQQYQQTIQDRFNDNLKQIQDKRASVYKDLGDGHIDINHYWENKSAPGKVASIIGLVLGGLTNTDAPVKMLQAQIEKDIDAQKQTFSNRISLLNANRQDFQNEMDATNMTRLMKADQIKNQIDLAIAKAKEPAAAARLQLLKGQLIEKYAPLEQQTAMRRAMMQGAGGGGNNIEQTLAYLRFTNPEMAKSLESRYVPQVGVAAIPVPQEDRSKILAARQLDNQIKDIQAFVRQNAGSLNPSIIAEGKSKMAQLQNGFRVAEKLGAFKQSEAGFIEGLTGTSPTSFLAKITTSPKLKAMMDQNSAAYRELLNSYHFTPAGGSAPPPQKFTPKPPVYGKR